MTHDSDRLILICQEQRYQSQSLGELRHAQTLLMRRLEAAEQEIATLKAAWVASRVEGAGDGRRLESSGS